MMDSNLTVDQAFQAAMTHHREGRLPQAEELYRRILAVVPGHADSLHLLGLLASQTGQHGPAVELIGQAIAINGGVAAYHLNLGNALGSLGRLDQAAAAYEAALRIAPDHPGALSNLGNILKDRGRLEEAIHCYEQALAIKPDFAEALSNMGMARVAQGKPDEAILCYEQALAIRPNFADALSNMGIALAAMGKLDEAITRYHQALAVKPQFPEALSNLGNALRDQGRLEEAIDRYEQALRIRPHYMEALANLGNALKDAAKIRQAIECYQRALAIKPESAEVLSNLSDALREEGRLDEAILCCEKALAIKPDFPEALCNIGNALEEQGRIDEAVVYFEKAIAIRPDYASAHDNLLFARAAQASFPIKQWLALARNWEERCVLHLPGIRGPGSFAPRPLAGRRLRIGYVSGDYRRHPTSFFVERVFAGHDRERVEIFAYSTARRRDDFTERLQALTDHWVSLVGLSDSEARDRIVADEIDILVDLSGHWAYNRLGVFALRAAPVQVNYLGFSGSGLSQMDYVIGDENLMPPSTDWHFREKVWRLPRLWVAYDAKDGAPPPAWRPADDGSLCIGGFNHMVKLTPESLRLWARVLHALPEARLLLKTRGLGEPAASRRIRDTLAAEGIADSRIELADHRTTPAWHEHMAYYDRLDVALDPVGGIGGGTTTCDLLWMAVPVITLEGDRMATRLTASVLRAIGRPEWIAPDEQGYIDKVVKLARDVEGRQAMRAEQRQRVAASPLCDPVGLARALEEAFVAMFERRMLPNR